MRREVFRAEHALAACNRHGLALFGQFLASRRRLNGADKLVKLEHLLHGRSFCGGPRGDLAQGGQRSDQGGKVERGIADLSLSGGGFAHRAADVRHL